jgi:serine/threonine protein kinase
LLLASAPVLESFGHFSLTRALGRRGRQSLFLARTRWPQCPWVTLKRLGVPQHRPAVRCLVHEARLTSHFSHPNLLRALDAGIIAGEPYLAMQFVLGRDLSQVCRRLRVGGVGTPFAVAVRILHDLLAGLAHVHELAEKQRPLFVVHRNIEPSNIALGFDGVVRIADFQFARSRLIEEEERLDGRMEIFGDPAFIAPEVVAGDRATEAADLYSLGAIAFELLTGLWDSAARHAWQKGTRTLGTLRPDLPRWFLRFVEALLESNPATRARCAAHLKLDLEARADIALDAEPAPLIARWLAKLFGRELDFDARILRVLERRIHFRLPPVRFESEATLLEASREIVADGPLPGFWKPASDRGRTPVRLG